MRFCELGAITILYIEYSSKLNNYAIASIPKRFNTCNTL